MTTAFGAPRLEASEDASNTVDDLDCALLFELDLNCRRSSAELSRVLNRSRQTVDYRIERLMDRGILLNFHTTINFCRMGYRLYKVHLRLRNLPHVKARLRDFLFSIGKVYWVGQCSGTWDILFGLFYRDERELFPVTNQLLRDYEDAIVEHAGWPMVDVVQFPKSYLTGKTMPPRMLIGDVMSHELDDADSALIVELVHDARSPLIKLADVVNLSPTAVQRRLQRLENLGIIVQYRVGVDIQKLNLEFYKVVINLNQYSEDIHRDFLAYVGSLPEVQYFLRNIWSVELELIVSNYGALLVIVDEIRRRFPRLIRSIDSLLVESDEWTSAFSDLIQKRSEGAAQKSITF